LLKRITVISGFVLIALFGYLPFELAECDKMIKEHGPVFICIPVTFVAIPALAAVFLALLVVLAIARARS